jgi:tetratricopeptide (TPR) repeat protein
MATKGLSTKIDDLFHQGEWEEAQRILEAERVQTPGNHWVLTQLGVTFYERHKYEAARTIFLQSLGIKDDCPLTLWNLAGTLDALGKHSDAMRVYTWLLQCKTTAKQDPCWESQKWTDALKTDCVYRMGVCFRRLGKKQEAEHCLRQYVNLLLTGIEGTYSIEDVRKQIHKLNVSREESGSSREPQRIFRTTLQEAGIDEVNGRRKAPPKFTEEVFLPGRRAARKK